MHRGCAGSKNGSNAMERYGTVWDCVGLFGTQRRDLQNRRVQVRFLSHVPRETKFMGLLPRGSSPMCVL
jgi:hypothetical protein